MNDIQTPTEAYVKALVGIGGQLTSTIHHMLTYSDQEDPPIAEVLTRLLTDIVDTELDEAPDDLYTAAGILNSTATAIEENLFLVPPEELPSRLARPRHRRR
jgi:hypothetical protein